MNSETRFPVLKAFVTTIVGWGGSGFVVLMGFYLFGIACWAAMKTYLDPPWEGLAWWRYGLACLLWGILWAGLYDAFAPEEEYLYAEFEESE